jgi:hypothetical protein
MTNTLDSDTALRQRPRSAAEDFDADNLGTDPGYLVDDNPVGVARPGSSAEAIGKLVTSRREQAARERTLRRLRYAAEGEQNRQAYELAMRRLANDQPIDNATMDRAAVHLDTLSEGPGLSSAEQHAARALERARAAQRDAEDRDERSPRRRQGRRPRS